MAQVFTGYPLRVRATLRDVRDLIYATAAATDGVGPLEETLRWGEPSYLTSKSGSGTTVRLGWKPAMGETCAVHVHCQTNLIATCRQLYPNELRYDGKRSVLLQAGEPLPDALGHIIELALTYHQNKRKQRAP